MMRRKYSLDRSGAISLELLLCIAVVVLVLQIFPGIVNAFLWGVDVRNWSRTAWFLFNLAFVLVLLGVRIVPNLYQDWLERRREHAQECLKHDKAQKLKEQREAVERMEQSRSRRIY